MSTHAYMEKHRNDSGKSGDRARLGLRFERGISKEEVELDESYPTRKHFQQVADLIKEIPDEKKRSDLAHHHAAIFAEQNPRFDRNRFFKAANVTSSVNEDDLKKEDVGPHLQDTSYQGDKEYAENTKSIKAKKSDAVGKVKEDFELGRNTYNMGLRPVSPVELEEGKRKYKTYDDGTMTADVKFQKAKGGKWGAFVRKGYKPAEEAKEAKRTPKKEDKE